MSDHNEEEYIKEHGRPSPAVLDVLAEARYFYRRSDDALFFFLGASEHPGQIRIRRPMTDQEVHMNWQDFVNAFRTRGYSD